MATYQDASTGQIVGTPVTTQSNDSQDRPTMHVKIYSPYQTYLDQEAYSISALNKTGPFDILSRHHNFMTLLVPCELSINTTDGLKRVRIDRGIMHVKADRVTVFLDV